MSLYDVIGLKHVGVDLDRKNRFQLLKSYYNAKYLFPHNEIMVYNTNRGYHIEILGIKSNIEARALLCDDPERIRKSEQRMRIMNRDFDDILFDMKKGFKREQINPLSEAFWD